MKGGEGEGGRGKVKDGVPLQYTRIQLYNRLHTTLTKLPSCRDAGAEDLMNTHSLRTKRSPERSTSGIPFINSKQKKNAFGIKTSGCCLLCPVKGEK